MNEDDMIIIVDEILRIKLGPLITGNLGYWSNTSGWNGLHLDYDISARRSKYLNGVLINSAIANEYPNSMITGVERG